MFIVVSSVIAKNFRQLGAVHDVCRGVFGFFPAVPMNDVPPLFVTRL
jgi:hypothetical protein